MAMCKVAFLEALKLFFLGHMAWAYVLAVVFAGKRRGKLLFLLF